LITSRRVSLSVIPPLPSSTITFQKYDLPDFSATPAGVLAAVLTTSRQDSQPEPDK
jgi:hypothetical protein